MNKKYNTFNELNEDLKKQRDNNKKIIKKCLPLYLESKGLSLKHSFTCLNKNHDDKHPSMRYNKKNNTVHCFSCGATYDIFDLIGFDYNLQNYKDQYEKALEIFNISDSLKDYQKLYESSLAREEKAEEIIKYDYSTYLKECAFHIKESDYLLKRGISYKTMQDYQIGYDSHYLASNGEYIKGITIPCGKYSYIIRNVDSNGLRYDRNKGYSEIFNIQAINNSNQNIFIVEGEIDALSIIEVGGDAIALGGVSKIYKLCKYLEDNKPKHNLILALDSDSSGRNATLKLKTILKKINIPYIINGEIYKTLDNEYKDANEFLINDKYGLMKKIDYLSNINKNVSDSCGDDSDTQNN